ncbi:MAG: GlsB/YeaQ/YmgE family stress response membrane protein [Micromonosporaceae bacterium]|nr:GlsB/YeaQ/YmgE family stress response membrane protein [Micromonosporaceae bacterium]
MAAIVIGIVIGGIGAAVLRRAPNALWLAPVSSVVGALIAAVLGAILGHAGYGWKKAALQVVLAIVGVAVAAVVTRRAASSSPTSSVESSS